MHPAPSVCSAWSPTRLIIARPFQRIFGGGHPWQVSGGTPRIEIRNFTWPAESRASILSGSVLLIVGEHPIHLANCSWPRAEHLGDFHLERTRLFTSGRSRTIGGCKRLLKKGSALQSSAADSSVRKSRRPWRQTGNK